VVLITYIIALVLVLLIPELYDIRRSYNGRDKLRTDLKPTIDKVLESAINKALEPANKLTIRRGQQATQPPAKQPNTDELKVLLEKLTAAPEGLEGLGRVVMTLGVIAIIGIAVIQLLLTSSTLIVDIVSAPVKAPYFNQTLAFADKARSDQTDIIKTLVTILGGALTTMIGFYFGTKAAEKKSDGTTQP